ncbi:hypothetical protein DWB85_07715 [Seongchinamella sediminis]|uniref:Uncharacterized protein n=1 Tax=Seongchinamella sediminis TaxID=2283635 RepID=A0A3L7DZ46_9GAMM|nr:hypothetical protein [Seongchinamella sediminis]RLQ22496.1 hypothetical protein DWB85_07715 [Seongchinamella sediminis]
MRSPWELVSRGQDDMEALQTDVMRFMAILGLCLAAIFSLVKSPDFHAPAQAPPAAAPSPAEPASAVPPEEPRSPPDPAPAPARAEAAADPRPVPPEPLAPATAADAGFGLEFESARALAALVAAGSVTLVVTDGESFWRWSGDAGLTETRGLSAYFAMEERTVPARFRLAADRQLGAGSKAWGVVLPVAIRAQIDAQVARDRGGLLTISADGTVSRQTMP